MVCELVRNMLPGRIAVVKVLGEEVEVENIRGLSVGGGVVPFSRELVSQGKLKCNPE